MTVGAGLLANLALALLAALAGALVALRLRQSATLGFILAGIAIGPFTPGFVADRAAVEALADLGVVFLLFSIGAQLSLGELLRSGRVAIVGGLIQVALVLALGAGVGLALGWGVVEALFFGAVLSNSSSTVLGKVLGERGEAESTHGRLALAWSTIQDLSTIVLVVLLSALAGDPASLVADVGLAVGKALLFLVLLVPLGLRLFPRFFDWVASFRNREVFILAVAAVALGTAFSATLFGVSLALGAFVAGLVVGDSDLSQHVRGEIVPLRDVLAGLFFVSVGMLVDPGFVVVSLPLVLLALALIILVKGTLVTAIARGFGVLPRTALLTGVALAQCAEFSFLLARVGRETGAVTAGVYSLMLAGAAASIALAPSLHTLAAPLARRLARLPVSTKEEHDPGLEALVGARRRAIICGYGAVGELVGDALARRGFGFVVIDQDPRVVRRLRAQEVPALLGRAENPLLLERAGLNRAAVLVVALPDPLAARELVYTARQQAANVDIVVRTPSPEEVRQVRALGATEAVAGEVEVGIELTRHALHRFGVSATEALNVVHGIRQRAGEASQEGLAKA